MALSSIEVPKHLEVRHCYCRSPEFGSVAKRILLTTLADESQFVAKGERAVPKSKQEIVDAIAAHFRGTPYGDCYVGITSDVKSRLFGDHHVSEQDGHWIYRTASSNGVAREIEQYFLDAGMDGGEGGGDSSSTIVYAYEKTSGTNP